MNVTLRIQWALGEGAQRLVETHLFGMLASIGEGGSLRSAAAETGVSYRHAWGLLAEWETLLGAPLVHLERGRGARLTPLGRALLRARDRIAERTAPLLRRLAAEALAELAEARPPSAPAPLRVFASHSLVVEALRGLAEREAGMPLDLHVCGSIESLRRLREGACDLAGFHIPVGGAGLRLARHYRRWLDPEQHRLIHVVSRQQGLMTAAKNPKRILSIADLARPGVRFINRQPESGTRLLFDELLARHRIDPLAIDGYRDEEFTHTAVASLIASGAADAGFGIAAVAARFGLTFLPLEREHYFFAVSAGDVEDPRIDTLIRLLRGPSFRAAVLALTGYDPQDAGAVVPVEAAYQGAGPDGGS